MSTLRLGSSGPDVAAWQRTIGVPADGDFGPKTLEATRRWQAAHGLPDDGVVGPKTREKAGGSGGQQQEQQQQASGQSSGSDFCFPFKSPPSLSWHGGARYFGAPRDHGRRKHGGCDIIKPAGEQIYAVADGVLIHEETYFYNNTWYVSFQHGPYVIRYGEILHGSTNRARRGWTVKKGQPIAKVGQLSGGSHMLHFEMYAHGNDHSTLRSERGPYMRRSDIMDPAPFLDKWVHNLP
ncbi:Membrane protein [Minicystis rosea]|nr:Membrane protein [Minicystis rosea]